MSVLCLDIATKTGWAVWPGPPSGVFSGVWDLKPSSGVEPAGLRLHRFWDNLRNTHRQFGIDHVFYEQPQNLHGHANRVLPHLVGVMQLWACIIDAPVECVTPSALKKFATGRGVKVSKNEMVESAQQRWPSVSITDHNQADALLILCYAMQQYEFSPH